MRDEKFRMGPNLLKRLGPSFLFKPVSFYIIQTLMERKKLNAKKLGHNIKVLEIGSGDPKIAVLNGLHGLEKSGAYLMSKLHKEVKLGEGMISFIPFANPTSALKNTRLTPEDSKDLNRIFPGKIKGSLSFKIAYTLFEYLKHFDLVIDIHNFPKMSMPLVGVFFYKGTVEQKDKVYALLKAFKPDYIWKLDTSEDETNKVGSLVESILDEGKLAFALETPDIELITKDQEERFVLGMMNVIKLMRKGLQRGEKEVREIPMVTRVAALSASSGFFEPSVKVGQDVKKGDILGKVVSMEGFRKSRVESPIGGPVVFVLRKTFVKPDRRVAIVGKYTDV